jgi:hydrogenase maturation factor HypF (carbamoyltransferase family)
VDDSVARTGAFGPVVLRRARGYAPGAVTAIPSERSNLAVGSDLKNTITLVVNGQAFFSQHIGDLGHYQSLRAFQETIQGLITMYEVHPEELLVVHDASNKLRQARCHLEAAMVQNALQGWDLNQLDFLFVENVGNLVCVLRLMTSARTYDWC